MEGLLVSFDVFISYASKDKIVADAVCARLEAAGIRCWIAPRDIVAGGAYGEAVIDGIHGAKGVGVGVFSSANASGHIPKEVERAVSSGVAILPFRIEDVAPGKSLDYFIGSVHWLDAMTPPMEKHLDDLATTVHKLIPEGADGQAATLLPPTVIWQHGRPGSASAAESTAATPPQMPQAQPAAFREAPHAAAAQPAVVRQAATPAIPKMAIWIGIAVVVALFVGWMFMRGDGNSTGGNDQQVATNPPSGNESTSNPNPSGSEVTPPANNAPATVKRTSPSPHSNVDPIVGCYQYSNGGPAVIHPDGTMKGSGPWIGRWAVVAPGHVYTFTWPVMIETLTISPDQRSM